MIRHAAVSVPVRLDFAGGWTDVAPFATEQRGVVVGAAIQLRTHVVVEPADTGAELRADDLDITEQLNHESPAPYDGRLALHAAAVRASGLNALRIRSRATAPRGSGLGTSGALAVGLVAALDAANAMRDTANGVADRAWRIETIDAAVAGGRQDQYSAAHGGWTRLEIDHGVVRVDKLVLDTEFLSILRRHLLLSYTGQSRFSANTITRVMDAFRAGQAPVVDALHRLTEIAERMAEALVASDLALVGTLLDANWIQQQRLDRAMMTDTMARLDKGLRERGVIGGKAAGSGAGGSMFHLLSREQDEDVTQVVRAAGATVLPFEWSSDGIVYHSC